MPKDEAKPGPEPNRVKLEGDWEKSIGAALKKERPKDGWPKPEKKNKKKGAA